MFNRKRGFLFCDFLSTLQAVNGFGCLIYFALLVVDGSIAFGCSDKPRKSIRTDKNNRNPLKSQRGAFGFLENGNCEFMNEK